MYYEVQWRYKSSLGGPWEAGQVVEMDELTAAWINADSPGVLMETDPQPSPTSPQPSPKGKGVGKNRMVKTATIPEEFVMGTDELGYGKELLKGEEG